MSVTQHLEVRAQAEPGREPTGAAISPGVDDPLQGAKQFELLVLGQLLCHGLAFHRLVLDVEFSDTDLEHITRDQHLSVPNEQDKVIDAVGTGLESISRPLQLFNGCRFATECAYECANWGVRDDVEVHGGLS